MTGIAIPAGVVQPPQTFGARTVARDVFSVEAPRHLGQSAQTGQQHVLRLFEIGDVLGPQIRLHPADETPLVGRETLQRVERIDLLDGGVTPTAVVMSWRGTEGGVRAARQGNEVVMAPTTHCYFDYYQTADTVGEPLAWGGSVS